MTNCFASCGDLAPLNPFDLIDISGGSVVVTRLLLLPEFSISVAVPVWVGEVFVMICDSIEDCEPVSEVSLLDVGSPPLVGSSSAEGVGEMTMKSSLVASFGSGSGAGVGSGVGAGVGAGVGSGAGVGAGVTVRSMAWVVVPPRSSVTVTVN